MRLSAGVRQIVPGTPAPTGRRDAEKGRDNSIRVDTSRLDQVLNLSGEIGLTKNRLTSLRADILAGKNDSETLHALDAAVSQLDLLVSDLQNAVMKTRMQPIGRLFQKYPRIARDLARNLGKDVELALVGEETEIDKTMIEDLSDPIIHLIRNAVDHGVEVPADRIAQGKPGKSVVRLEARQEGDHIVIIVADDGRGMNAERLRAKALEKGLITDEEANTLDERASLNLVFLPGFSTAATVSDVSGRGVGMDVVKTNIQKLNGSIEIRSDPGQGHDLHHFAAADAGHPAGAAGASGRAALRRSAVDGARNPSDPAAGHPGSRRPRDHGRAGRGDAGAAAGPTARLAAEEPTRSTAC
jgi:two-component system chemotaxis sensor kinase CheA